MRSISVGCVCSDIYKCIGVVDLVYVAFAHGPLPGCCCFCSADFIPPLVAPIAGFLLVLIFYSC